MATKLCWVLTYGEAKPIKNLHESDHMITRGHVSNWKLNISSSTGPIPPHLAGWWGMTFWPCSLVRLQEKVKMKIYIHLWKLIHAKKFKIGILENKFTPKLISFRQSNLFLENFLIKNLSLTKISNMILTQFQAMLQFYTHLKHKKTRDQGGYKWRIGWK